MAKIDFKKHVFRNLDEKPIPKEDPTPEDPQHKSEVSMAEVVQAELLKEDPTGTPTERFESFLLAKKIKQGEGEIDLTVEELALIKKISGKNPNPLIIGRIWEIVEALEPTKKKE
jgi:hypothetical protein